MKPIIAYLTALLGLISSACFSQSIEPYDVLITEIMSDPTPAIELPEDEYLEIFNASEAPIQLANIELWIGHREVVPDSFLLLPDSFYVFWDPEIPALKNGGDSLKITFDSNLIHKVDYKPSMHESDFKENGGWSLELFDFNKPCLSQGNWQSSINKKGGTPGKMNSNIGALDIAEVQLETYFPINDSTLELTFNVPVDSIWTDLQFSASENILRIAIPKLDSNSFQVFTIRNPQTCFDHTFGDQTINYALPNVPDSGELIINEILFNPDPSGCDFIEIFNPTMKAFDISQLSFSKFDEEGLLEAAERLYHLPRLILPNEHLVFCSNPNWVNLQFPNAKNVLKTSMPSMNNDEGSLVLINKSGEIIDHLFYREDWHYPELNDPENVSLEKIIPQGINNSSNWTSASSFENFATPGYQNSNYTTITSSINNFEFEYDVITPNGDGYQDQLLLKYNFDSKDWIGSIDVINANGITIHSITSGALFGKRGVIQWDGYLNTGSVIKPGIYALWINAYNHSNQESIREKITFYINGKLQ